MCVYIHINPKPISSDVWCVNEAHFVWANVIYSSIMTRIHTQNPIENIPNPKQHILALYLMWHWCLRGLARAAGVTAEVHTWLSTYTARKLFITCSGSREASHREAADERKGKAGMLISPKHTWMQTKTSHCRQILPAFFLSVSLAKLLCDFSHSFSELSQSHFPLSFSWFCT